MSERIPCKTPGCPRTILPETAQRTGGICMLCVQQKARVEYEEYIRKNRVDVNLYEGVTDPVEVIKIMLRPHKHDPLVNLTPYPQPFDHLIGALEDEAIRRLIDYALELLAQQNPAVSKKLAPALACFTSFDLDRLQAEFLKRGIFYPGVIFRNASPRVRDALLERLDVGADRADHLLIALAWVGDERVVECFSQWCQRIPPWASQLCVPPAAYTRVAGWELNGLNQRRNLYSQECYALLPSDGRVPFPVAVMRPNDECCPWCHHHLVDLFGADLSDSRLSSLGLNIPCLNLTTCQVCSCFTTVFTDIAPDGGACWSRYNVCPDYLPEDISSWEQRAEKCMILQEKSRSPLHAASWLLNATNESQIGGHPCWVQDDSYPACPRCHQIMPFIGQIALDELYPLSEGTYYGFLCRECLIAATTYQQT